MALRIVLFLVINFATLGIGRILMVEGPASDWYMQLNKAPWTPPGWVFGAAWTLIMICFAVYLAILWERLENKRSLIVLYAVQVVLNIMWNPIFFDWQQVSLALVVIVALTVLVGYILVRYFSLLRYVSLLLLPYLLWLLIATSLNGYVLVNN